MDKRLIVALDFPDAGQALKFAAHLPVQQCRLKVGFELFVSAGPGLVEKLVGLGFDVFLDLKFHDIPNTVAAACRSASQLGVWMINVHAMGGQAMLTAAVDAVGSLEKPPLLIAVTVLTSMDKLQLKGVGVDAEPREQVLMLAQQVAQCGLDGVVCSAQEAALLKQEMGQEFKLVTPGIRPSNSDISDQKRVMTPKDAILAGANYLVVGRPITTAKDSLAVIESINQDISSAALSMSGCFESD